MSTPLTTCPHCNARVESGALFCVHCGEAIPIVTPASDPFIGRTVARNYRIVKEIARGGMGVVYLARHEELGQRVAVKFLHRRFADDEELAARFFNEARAASKVAHPYAVSIYDFSRLDDGTLFIVMEYVEGQPLYEMIRAHGRLAPRVAVPIAIQACQVLDVAHENQLVHRDVKPDNMMVIEGRDQNLTIKMLDFGIAKILDGEAGAGLTQTGMMFGTPEYMSPEQASGTGVDHRSDIYSLGVVLYEMLVGQPPFRGRNKLALLQRHIRETPTPVERACPAPLPRGLAEAIASALAKDANDRPQSMAEFAHRLQEIVLDEPRGARAVAPTLSHEPLDAPDEPYVDAASAIGVRETGYELGAGDAQDDAFAFDDEPAVPSDGYSFGDEEQDFDDVRTTGRAGVVRSERSALPILLLVIATIVGSALVLRAIDKSAEARALATEGSGEADVAVAMGSGEGSAEGSGIAAEDAAPPVVAAASASAASASGDPRPSASSPVAPSEPVAAPPSTTEIDGLDVDLELERARAAIREGDMAEAAAIADRLEALDRDDEDVDALRGDILAIARLRAVIEGHLAEENCLRADEGVVRLREEYSRRLAFGYYPQLEACRAARRAARSSASPQPPTAPSGSTGSSGRVLPPAEL